MNLLQEGTYLFSTNYCTTKRLSQPEETYETVNIAWVWDYYGSTTLLIKQPDNDQVNTLFEIYSIDKIEQTYYLSAKNAAHDEYYEIILDAFKRSVEIKMISPIQGINYKYYQK